jgi:cytochrome c oxidase subunit 4
MKMEKKRLYVMIWAILVAATLLEVLTRSLSIGYLAIVGAIIVISITKASLVALYYQHLRYEKYLALFPIGALITLTLLILTSISGGG